MSWCNLCQRLSAMRRRRRCSAFGKEGSSGTPAVQSAVHHGKDTSGCADANDNNDSDTQVSKSTEASNTTDVDAAGSLSCGPVAIAGHGELVGVSDTEDLCFARIAEPLRFARTIFCVMKIVCGVVWQVKSGPWAVEADQPTLSRIEGARYLKMSFFRCPHCFHIE